MLSKDELKQKRKTKRHAQLVKHVANTLTTVMNNLVLSSSASNIDCDVECNKGTVNNQVDRCAKHEAYNSLSTELSSSHSADSFTDAENHLPFPDTVFHRKHSHTNSNDKDVNKTMHVSAKGKNSGHSSSDMRETSWVIPEDATSMWLAFSDAELESSSSDYKDKKTSPKKHKLLSRYSQDSDSSDSNTPVFPVRPKSTAQISSIIKPAEQYFESWYTDNNKYAKQNKLTREKKNMQGKISGKHGGHKSTNNHRSSRTSSPHSKLNKHGRRHRRHRTLTDSCSSDSDNDLKFTTVVKRPEFSSSDEDMEYTNNRHHKSKNQLRNNRYSELYDTDTSADSSPYKSRTIGYLVRKPVAKLCMTDAGVVLSAEKDPKNHKGHTNKSKVHHYGGEGDHDMKQKSFSPRVRSGTANRRHNKRSNDQEPRILLNRDCTSKANEESESPVYMVRSHTNANTRHPQKATKAWMSDRRSDKCRYTAIDKALYDIRKCLQKESKKSENVSKKQTVLNRR